MRHLVFVYGTLLAGEVNHGLLGDGPLLGAHRTAPRFELLDLGAYPGAVRGGGTRILGEVVEIDSLGLARLDRLEEYPRLYDRERIPTPFGRAWIYLYRSRTADRPRVPNGDWRAYACNPDSYRAAGIRSTRSSKNRRWAFVRQDEARCNALRTTGPCRQLPIPAE